METLARGKNCHLEGLPRSAPADCCTRRCWAPGMPECPSLGSFIQSDLKSPFSHLKMSIFKNLSAKQNTFLGLMLPKDSQLETAGSDSEIVSPESMFPNSMDGARCPILIISSSSASPNSASHTGFWASLPCPLRLVHTCSK